MQSRLFYSWQGNYLFPADIVLAESGKKDYIFCDNANLIGGAEVIGVNPHRNQEDRVDYNYLPGWLQLNNAEQDKVIQKTLIDFQCNVIKDALRGGSCLLIAIISPTTPHDYEIITINLGDSEALLVNYDRENSESRLHRLNNIHHPDQEVDRLAEFKPFIQNNRIQHPSGCAIALSRSVGDVIYDDFGMSHHPEILRTSLKKADLEKNESWLILCCDGLRESPDFPPHAFATAIEYCSDNLAQLSRRLVKMGLESGSLDNISVLTTPLHQRQFDTPLALAVYDGHGGQEVSEYARIKFLEMLRTNILTLAVKKHHQHNDFAQANTSFQQCIQDLLELVNQNISDDRIKSSIHIIEDKLHEFQQELKDLNADRISPPRFNQTLFAQVNPYSSFIKQVETLLEKLKDIKTSTNPKQALADYFKIRLSPLVRCKSF